MKKIKIFTWVLTMMMAFVSCDISSLDEPIELNDLDNKSVDLLQKNNNKGFNEFGHNWDAHHFSGNLFNAIIGDTLYEDLFGFMTPYNGDESMYLNDFPFASGLPFWGYRKIHLVMHWNEELIARGGVYPQTWINSNGWITFHYSGLDENGKRWSQFQKMVSAKSTDYFLDGKWYNMSDEEIGVYSTWDELILIQVVNTGNIHPDFFEAYVNPSSSGIGKYKIH